MFIGQARRGLLYFFSAFFILFGLACLFAPALLAAKLNLMPADSAGTGEVRSLYGGGFAGFGLVIFAGLRCKQEGRGLLLAMSIIIGGIVVGRLFSIVIDHDYSFAAPNAILEFIMAAACYFESRQGLERA
jgi:hypothetical protein